MLRRRKQYDPVQQEDKALVERLSRSRIFRDYEKAFSTSTGLPVALTSTISWGLPHHRERAESPFCAMMADLSKSCAACLEVQQRLQESARTEPVTVTCFAGLCDTAVPVNLGDRRIGFLQTGQVFTRKPTEQQFDKVASQLIAWGLQVDLKQLKEAYFSTKVLSGEQYQAMIRLLRVFAEHLSLVSNQIVVEEHNAEAPMISRAKEFIEKNQGEDIDLQTVARAVNTSTFYFCKMFKKATGLTFTDYLGRVRVEKAKELLLNPHVRISEVAFEVGFQSLSQFNRVFRKIAGLSPTDFRSRLVRHSAR
ncbi:MAG: helix-turn-helix domain-containing protein [Puniceicoccaceae bacterium]|nr:MAG: helix-turn-helix domain-containing protein [Puniceicoccaceae bacterium]